MGKKKKDKIPKIKRETILLNIAKRFFRIQHFLVHYSLISAAEVQGEIESLVQLLEVHDCGSIGGFDPDNKVRHLSKCSLFNRFVALCDKYGHEEYYKGKDDIVPLLDFYAHGEKENT